MTIHTSNLQEYREKGNTLFASKNYEEAIKIYKQGLRTHKQDPNTNLLYSNIAICHLKLNKFQKTIKYCDLVLQSDSTDEKALYRRSLAHQKQNNLTKAFQDCRQLTTLHPQNSTYSQRLSSLHEFLQREHTLQSNPNLVFTNLLHQPHPLLPNDSNQLLIMSQDMRIKHSIFTPSTLSSIHQLLENPLTFQLALQLYTNYLRNIPLPLTTSTIPLSPTNDTIPTINDFISTYINSAVSNYTSIHLPPTIDDAYSHHNEYIRNFTTFFTTNPTITLYITTLFSYLTNISLNNESKVDTIKSINKTMKLNKYIGATLLHFDTIPTLISTTSPINLSDLTFWQNYETNRYIFNLISLSLETIYESMKCHSFLIQQYLAVVDSTLHNIWTTSDSNEISIRFLTSLYPLVQINNDVVTHILIESPHNFGDKIINICNQLTLQITTSYTVIHDNMLVFLCELFFSLQTCKKFNGNKNFQQLTQLLFPYAHRQPNRHLKLLGLLALSRLTTQSEDQDCECVQYYQEARSILLNCDVISSDIKVLEVVSFLSLNPSIKEMLIDDKESMHALFKITLELCKHVKRCINNPVSGDNFKYLPNIFCCLSIFANLINIKYPDEIKTESVDEDSRKELKKLAQSAGQPIAHKHPKNKKRFVAERTKKLSDIHFFSLLNTVVSSLKVIDDHAFSKRLLSVHSPYYVVTLLLATLRDCDVRGIAAQAGIVKTLLILCRNLHPSKHPPDSGSANLEYPFIAAHALSLVAIAIDPSLCFNDNTIIEALNPLFCIADFKNPNLRRFESLLALTNIASFSNQVREYIADIDASFQIIESAIFDLNPMIKRAAVELTNNLVMCEKFVIRHIMPETFISQKNIPVDARDRKAERIRIFLLLAGELEDVQLSCAAAGVLAFLSHYRLLCQYMQDIAPFVEIIKEIMHTDEEQLIYRIVYILQNFAAHDEYMCEFVELNFGQDLKCILQQVGGMKNADLSEKIEKSITEIVKKYIKTC